MSTTPFDPNDPATWPLTLFTEHLAAIRGYSTNWISQRATVGQFHPAPVRGGGRGQRWEWRKADVVKFVVDGHNPHRFRKVG